MENKQYSFSKGLLKTVINAIVFVGPVAVNLLPATWANLTLSGALYLLINWFKNRSSV
jgi:hypothetical protein